MPLTAEERAAIRRRIQSQFGAPDVRHESESTSSLAPPGYNRKSFQPDRRSVDHLDPPAIDAPATDPEPALTHDIESIDDPRRKCVRAETHRPLLCDQFPGKRFAITEAADEANVPTLLIFAAVKDGGRKPVGRKKLVFYHEDSANSGEVEMDSPQKSQQEEETAKGADPVPAYISEKPDNGRVPVDPEKFNEALGLLKQGVPNSEVAQKTGLHHSTVRKIVRDEIWAKKSKPVADKRNGRKPKVSKSRDDYCLTAERRAAQQRLNEEILAVQKKYDEVFRAIETVEKLMAERAMAED